MIQFTIEEILKATNGTLLMGSGPLGYPSISIDSRTIRSGELFIAIKGKNFDGHNFVAQSLMKGGSGAIVSDRALMEKTFFRANKDNNRYHIIAVDDTLKALHNIANYYRRKFTIPVVGITGSNGKSTTKEMAASIAGIRFRVLKNEGNLNNQIGLPMTLLRMEEGHDVAIVEMGMSEKGEIRKLCQIAEPSIGVITNVGKAHMEHLGSIEDIRDAKGELIMTIEGKGTVILNSDDPLVIGFKNKFRGRVLTFGINSPSDVKALNFKRKKDLGYQFILKISEKEIMVNLSYPGYHNIYNALSSAAIGVSLGMDINDIGRGIESFRPLPMRMERFMIDGDITIINDAYNANPSSMEAAIKTFSVADFPGKKFLIAGDMLELGEVSEESHRYIGRLVASESIDYLITFGRESKFISQEAILSGMPKNKVYSCENFDEVAFILDDELNLGDCLLIKGSRGMGMEKLVDRIVKLRKAS
ncbi:MAG: hypothetical protein A3I04_01760 [Nitrospinae bacterium RIFCSPLOWO2_02_FULL_39_110]|nr:MAG: hypothetical protein A2W53_01015 [Nitrospinae bacterium RIFCSPHIGHO2_02_39_11]OGV99304.1 MAG: hypothetical protein A3D97_08575 [Nitrospinae bacterium RIFCSPHIGHO2_12_FULL_39_42]OGW01543.1 MAG: hypothetical protein A3D20_04015 [Nitrospinae bacterium RIFCSPHIGHO2_02_FULL_39_82]OGW05641.1 MAG: hypothetical protein A3I04_01760 [Nitrospinae bacterium RIFCSPLOWO2_02_FULL_39_110]OGW07001.1 MAG: hypothetical protein A2Z59_01445 [Nitrospinae bacterium RIFCSPLOWO2_02_39_17]OGW10642.1 MAG: hypoth